MKRHPFDPFSLVLGLFFGGLALYFLFGDRTIADLGPAWIWPFPVLLVGLLSVMYAVKGLHAARPAGEPLPVEEAVPVDEDVVPPED